MDNLKNVLYLENTKSNYFNRVVFKITEDNYSPMLVKSFSDTNFAPNNGIVANIKANLSESEKDRINYLIVQNSSTLKFLSRWHIVGKYYLSEGMYELQLQRDIIADKYDFVVQQAIYLEKAHLPNSSTNPLIYNSEPVALNQIKKSEHLIQDNFKDTTWATIFYNETAAEIDPLNIEFIPSEMTASYIVNELSDWEYAPPTGSNNWEKVTGAGSDIKLHWADRKGGITSFRTDWTVTSKKPYDDADTLDVTNLLGTAPEAIEGVTYNVETLKNAIKSHFSVDKREEMIELLWKNSNVSNLGFDLTKDYKELQELYHNKVLKDISTNKFYKINVSYYSTPYRYLWYDEVDNDFTQFLFYLYLDMEDFITEGTTTDYMDFLQGQTTNIWGRLLVTTISLEELPAVGLIECELDKAFNYAENNPYKVVTIPISDKLVFKENSFTSDISNKATVYDAVNEFIRTYSGESPNIIDVQMLPYCPISTLNGLVSDNEGTLEVTLNETLKYVWLKLGEVNKIPVFNVPFSDVKYRVPFGYDINDIKIDNTTTFARIVSHNYNGAFEFSPAKNEGIDGFDISMTLKPLDPFIHIAPVWGGLYAGQSNSSVGMAVTADMGWFMQSDSYFAFKRQNANNQLIFDRGIQSLEFGNELGYKIQDAKNQLQAQNNQFNAVLKTAGGVLSAGAGLVTGNPLMIAGGAAATASGINSLSSSSKQSQIADQELNNRKLIDNENNNAKRDIFNYQMGNMQASPNSYNRGSSFNVLTKTQPFLEIYDCTDREKALLKNKLDAEGYTIGAIDLITNYLPREKNYIKGSLVFANGEDMQTLLAINNELQQGIYILIEEQEEETP